MSLTHDRGARRPRRGDRPAGWEPTALAGALTAYNLALNRVPFPAAWYVPANLALTTVVTLLARRRWGIRAADLGIAPESVRPGLRLGAACAAAVALGLAAAARVPAAAPLLGDRRAEGVHGGTLAYQMLLRIPLGTAVPEEVLFRGVLLEAFRRSTSERRAVLASSWAFGAWHIGPALTLLEVNHLARRPGARAAAVGVLVAGTATAGVGFGQLRRRGRGLLAPVIAHAAIGSLSLRAAARSRRP